MLGYQGNTEHALRNNNHDISYGRWVPCSMLDYTCIRQQYLPKDLCISKSLFDFYNILRQSDCNVTRKISTFIFYMFKNRNSITICEIRLTYLVTFTKKWTHYLFHHSNMFVCLKETSHGDVSFKHEEHTIWQKGGAYWGCFVVCLAETCFECSGGTFHRDFSF